MTTSIIEEINMSIDKQTTLVHLKCMTERYIKCSFIYCSANDFKKQENIRKIEWYEVELFFNAMSNIPKDTGRDDMNSSTVHAIWMIVPSSLAKKIIFYSGGTIITV